MQPGINLLVRELLADAGPAADALLEIFVSVLFCNRRTVRTADPEARFKLAELTIRILRENDAKCETRALRFQNWLRQAVLPTRVVEHTMSGDASVVRTFTFLLLAIPALSTIHSPF